MTFWRGVVPPWVLRRLGLTRGRLSPMASRCRRCFQRGPRAGAVHGAGIADHNPGDGRTVALSREVGACCDRDKRCCGCDES